MGGGGGKGGSQSTQTEIPQWVAQPATRNLARAEEVQQIGYQPYYGADVAAFNPTQQAAMQSNIDAAKAFGLVGQDTGLTPMSGMPQPTTFAGGIQGYSAGPMFDQAVAELEARNPEQSALYNRLFNSDVRAKPVELAGSSQPQYQSTNPFASNYLPNYDSAFPVQSTNPFAPNFRPNSGIPGQNS